MLALTARCLYLTKQSQFGYRVLGIGLLVDGRFFAKQSQFGGFAFGMCGLRRKRRTVLQPIPGEAAASVPADCVDALQR